MRNAVPRVDHVRVDVDDAFGVPVPVVADVPVPRDDLAARDEGVTGGTSAYTSAHPDSSRPGSWDPTPGRPERFRRPDPRRPGQHRRIPRQQWRTWRVRSLRVLSRGATPLVLLLRSSRDGEGHYRSQPCDARLGGFLEPTYWVDERPGPRDICSEISRAQLCGAVIDGTSPAVSAGSVPTPWPL